MQNTLDTNKQVCMEGNQYQKRYGYPIRLVGTCDMHYTVYTRSIAFNLLHEENVFY